MTDVLINLPPSESKSNENTDLKTDIMNQLKKNDIACNSILDEQSWRQKEIIKFCLYILLFVVEPIGYYSLDIKIGIEYKVWLDILFVVFLAIIPFGITIWYSYQPIFLNKVFPWTFISEILLLLTIVLRSKFVFQTDCITNISIISFFLIQFYTTHRYIFMILIENFFFLLIYIIVYNKLIFSKGNKFILGKNEFFFPVYLIIITIINIISKLNLQKNNSNNNTSKLMINTKINKTYDQCNTPAEKAMYICRVVMETPQIEQQDLMLMDKLQASLLEKIMKETGTINEKKDTKPIVQKYSIENTAVITDGNEFDEQQCDTPKIEVVDSESLNKLFSDIDSWDWNVFDYAKVVKNPLYYLTRHMFERENLFSELNIPEKEFNRFIGLIEKGYHDLPFHNKIHATDVLHGMNYLVKNPRIKAMCSTVDIMCCYISAIIHDYDHPGYSNVYLINIQDEMSILYNDQRVLENHHLAKAWELLLKPENNFLKNFDKKEFLKIRKLIIELVLATDLSQHNQLLCSFKDKIMSNPDLVIDDDAKELILKIIIKFADVSNTSKTWDIYTYWIERIMTEFYRQGDHEREHGLPVTKNFDRNEENAPLCQINFIKFICEPINKVIVTYLQDKIFEKNINYNLKRLEKLESLKLLKVCEKDSDVTYDE